MAEKYIDHSVEMTTVDRVEEFCSGFGDFVDEVQKDPKHDPETTIDEVLYWYICQLRDKKIKKAVDSVKMDDIKKMGDEIEKLKKELEIKNTNLKSENKVLQTIVEALEPGMKDLTDSLRP